MIVDSSKDLSVYYLLCSSSLQNFSNSYKETQAFVYSMSKNQSNTYKIIRLSLKYLIENYMIGLYVGIIQNFKNIL